MLKTKNSAPGSIRPLSATALIAATILIGGLSDASAKSRKHHASSSWRNANASVQSSGSGSFAGVASFYGNESGSRTASGQRFNENDMTAAHRSLPFGTKLRVTDTSSGRFVTVRVNDRGPFVRGRVVDVSPSAAEALGMVDKGITNVRLEVVQ